MIGQVIVLVFWIIATIIAIFGAFQLVRQQVHILISERDNKKIKASLPVKIVGGMVTFYIVLTISVELFLNFHVQRPRSMLVTQEIDKSASTNAFSDFGSVLRLHNSSAIDCAQVRKLPDGQWDVFGTITSNGVRMSQSIVGPHEYIINGRDFFDEIQHQCG